MKLLARQMITQIKPYFDSLIKYDEQTGLRYIYDDELGDRASCCLTGTMAAFYVAFDKAGGKGGFELAAELVKDVRDRQLPIGAFYQPYYVKKGDPQTVDIAEIGAAANFLYHVNQETGSFDARESLLCSADYLLTQVSERNPGVVMKRPGADFDVLNGDMYAAHTFARAYEVSGNELYLLKATQIVEHLANRFGKNSPGWWPYIENWDGSVEMGNSVLYQATIVSFAHNVIPLLSEQLQEQWREINDEAMNTMVQAIKQPPSEETEAPWWSRDWTHGWELYIALWRESHDPIVQELGIKRFREVYHDLSDRGMTLFKPKIKHDEPDRTPVTTTFRKAAGFAGILATLLLDD